LITSVIYVDTDTDNVTDRQTNRQTEWPLATAHSNIDECK